MIKVILIAALVIAATAATCTTTYTECATCATPTGAATQVCATCSTGFNLPATQLCGPSTCTNYLANCHSCSADTPLVCESCNPGYVYDSTNSVCVSCTTGATGYSGEFVGYTENCAVTDSKVLSYDSSCDTTAGYYWDTTNSACVNCGTGTNSAGVTYTGVTANCDTCTNALLVLTCTDCATGYYFDSTNFECISCMTGKTTAGTATDTYSGFNADCAACDVADIEVRILAGTVALSCTNCATDYEWDSGNSVCVNCATGTNTGTGLTYTGLSANCKECGVTGSVISCGACATGYVWDTTNSICASCVTGSGTKIDNGATATDTGFDANCATCSSASGVITCLTCSSDYYLNFDNTCVSGTPLDTNCMYYAGNNGHCVECTGELTTGSTFSNDCITCPSNCDVCDAAGACTVCNSGFSLSTTTTGTCKASGANIIMPGFALLSIIFYYLF